MIFVSYAENLIVSKNFRRFRVIQYTADRISSADLMSVLHYSHSNGTFHSVHVWVIVTFNTVSHLLIPITLDNS